MVLCRRPGWRFALYLGDSHINTESLHSFKTGVDTICGLSLLLVLSLRDFSPGTPVFPSSQNPTLPNCNLTWLAQLGECWSAGWEVMGSNPGRTNTQGL